LKEKKNPAAEKRKLAGVGGSTEVVAGGDGESSIGRVQGLVSSSPDVVLDEELSAWNCRIVSNCLSSPGKGQHAPSRVLMPSSLSSNTCAEILHQYR
jgi:hypothetical protein